MNSPTLSIHATEAGHHPRHRRVHDVPNRRAGRPVDKRSDIWAFGVVLFEMLTGRQVFEGETVSHVIAAVLKDEPDWTALPPDTPASIRRLLRRCLEKDRKRRLDSAAAVRIEIDDASTLPNLPNTSNTSLVWVTAAIAVVSLALAAFVLWSRPAPIQQSMARLTISLPPDQEITTAPAITRDGRTVAYVTQRGTDDSQLYLRDLNSFEARAVAGSAGAKQPFFSPDGKWVGFFAQGQLQKVEVAGGTPVRLAEAPIVYGGTWSDDNTIIYSPSLGAGLWRIPAGGGTPEPSPSPMAPPRVTPTLIRHRYPGGRPCAVHRDGGQSQGGAVLSLESRQVAADLARARPRAAPIFEPLNGSTGRLLVVDQSAGIKAAPFDAAQPAPTIADASVLTNVYYDVENEVRAWLAVSTTGTAVYAPGRPGQSVRWCGSTARGASKP